MKKEFRVKKWQILWLKSMIGLPFSTQIFLLSLAILAQWNTVSSIFLLFLVQRWKCKVNHKWSKDDEDGEEGKDLNRRGKRCEKGRKFEEEERKRRTRTRQELSKEEKREGEVHKREEEGERRKWRVNSGSLLAQSLHVLYFFDIMILIVHRT